MMHNLQTQAINKVVSELADKTNDIVHSYRPTELVGNKQHHSAFISIIRLTARFLCDYISSIVYLAKLLALLYH